MKELNHLEDLGLGGRITLKWILKSGMGGIDWIDLAEGRGRWVAFCNEPPGSVK